VEVSFERSNDESLHPVRQATVVIGGNRLGVIGELHPKVVEAFDISETAYLFEINVTALLPFTISHKMFQSIPRFPAVVRDMALIVDVGITHQKMQDVIATFPLVSQVALFDVYAGEQVTPGKKSLAYRVTFQSPAHTLTEEEASQVQQQILDKLSHQFGATLRS